MAALTPREVADALGIPERTLRNWSSRFEEWLAEPARSRPGQRGRTHRRYASEDLEKLKLVKRLADQHVPLDQIAEILAGRRPAPPLPDAEKSRRSPLPKPPGPVGSVEMTAVIERQLEQIAELEGRLRRTEYDLTARIRELESRLAQLETSLREAVDRQPERAPSKPTAVASSAVEGLAAGLESRSSSGFLGAVRARFIGGRPPQGLARNIVRELARKGWGRGDLAVAAGVSLDTVDRVLAGDATEPHIVGAIARVLDMNVEDLQADR